MGHLGNVGLVLHPQRDSAFAIDAIVEWARRRDVRVLGLAEEVGRIDCAAVPVGADRLAADSDLVVSLGGDGTLLRALRLVRDQAAPVLGVNLGRLGFLAEVDVADVPAALSAIDEKQFSVERRTAVRANFDGRSAIAFNDVALVRTPGRGMAAVALRVNGVEFVRYAADAIIVATPTGSTAYSFSAGGPIVSPGVPGLLVTPASPHSAFNRALFLSTADDLALDVLTRSGRLAVEVDGLVAGEVGAGDLVDLTVLPGAAQIVRLGRTTFYDRARRKLRLAGSAEVD